MKKISVILAAILAVTTLAGCSASNEPDNVQQPTGEPTAPVSTPADPDSTSADPDSTPVSSADPDPDQDRTPDPPMSEFHIKTPAEWAAESSADAAQSAADAAVRGSGKNSSSSSEQPDLSALFSILESYSSNSSSSSSNNSPSSSEPVIIDTSTLSSISSVAKVCGLKSKVETSVEACIVNVDKDHNPYGIVYDYGANYDAYVKACDWSLVFDADFYIKAYPMLALQYHGDKALLLEHFQTVGIHEGRQANSNFNVGVYKNNCDKAVSATFGNNYEGYYFYYMLNYASEKSVATKAVNDSVLQQKSVMTALQSEELKKLNEYRAEGGKAALKFDSELAAFAAYRGWLNVHDSWGPHEWVEEGKPGRDFVLNTLMPIYNAAAYNENNCEFISTKTTGKIHAECYRNSPSHYKTLMSDKTLIGISDSYTSTVNKSTYQFDCFIKN